AFCAEDAQQLEKLFDWDFNVLKMRSHDAMRMAVISLFEKEITLAEINISRSQLQAYIAEVDKNYRLSELALLYNDTAVLENHHCATAFRLMRLPGLDIFQHLNFSERKECRKMMVSCILATDMDVHVTLVETMASKADDQWCIESPADKIFYGKYILHCADLSNPV
ncbi:Pde4a, partial [Symbiodinium microadriaticum]